MTADGYDWTGTTVVMVTTVNTLTEVCNLPYCLLNTKSQKILKFKDM